jgi:hypothetical protein
VNRVGENFPGTATTILSVCIEYSISKCGICGSDRTSVADVPSLDFLKGQPEQSNWRRSALVQQSIEFAEEGHAVAVIVIQNHNNRVDAGRPAEALQETRQPVKKNALIRGDSSFQVPRKLANSLVSVDVPRVWGSMSANDPWEQMSEQQLSGLVFHQNLDVHFQFTSR